MNTLQVRATTIDLFERYPHVSDRELDHLIAVFPRLPALDVALMLSDEDLAPKLTAFRRDHHKRIRTPFRDYAVLIGIAVVGTAVSIWSMLAAG